MVLQIVMTDLEALKSDEPQARKSAFESLKADAYRISYSRLHGSFPLEIEDVVLESLTEIYGQIDLLKTNEDLAKLTKSIAENHAISRWRSLTAKKRGSGNVESLDALKQQEGDVSFDPPAETPRLNNLDLADIRNILETLQKGLKLEYKQALNDSLVDQLSSKEIAQKRGWPMGSVGVYVSRGLKMLRNERLKYPKLTEAAMQYILMLLV